jgi:hypothetical protein
LNRLAENLRGLIAASELRDIALEQDWWDHFIPIDMELELRTEAWAPPGAASDDHLSEVLAAFKGYVAATLARTSGDRT